MTRGGKDAPGTETKDLEWAGNVLDKLIFKLNEFDFKLIISIFLGITFLESLEGITCAMMN